MNMTAAVITAIVVGCMFHVLRSNGKITFKTHILFIPGAILYLFSNEDTVLHTISFSFMISYIACQAMAYLAEAAEDAAEDDTEEFPDDIYEPKPVQQKRKRKHSKKNRYQSEPYMLNGHYPGSVEIHYTDGNGDYTERVISNPRFSQNTQGRNIIEAYCTLAGANRTFRVERIENVVTEYGEVVNPYDYFLGIIE